MSFAASEDIFSSEAHEKLQTDRGSFEISLWKYVLINGLGFELIETVLRSSPSTTAVNQSKNFPKALNNAEQYSTLTCFIFIKERDYFTGNFYLLFY